MSISNSSSNCKCNLVVVGKAITQRVIRIKESDIFECLFIIRIPKCNNNWLKSKNQS